MHKPSYFIRVLLLILLTFSSLTLYISPSQGNSTPTLYVDPPFTNVNIGESFSINASIANVTDLGGWEFKLYYQNNILAIITATEGQFLKQGGSTAFFTVELNNNYNTTHGRIWLTCTLLGSVPGVNGSGTLATINFQAVGGGNTTLHLSDTVLGDSQANSITHTTNDGNVHVIGIGDIAITNVTPLKTIVGQGYNMKINVTIENQGDKTETFNVTAYANTTIIDTLMDITLTVGNSTTVTFLWNNTTDLAKGNYTISAYAWPVPSETDTADNIKYADQEVCVTIPGDVDSDFDVDLYDAVTLLKVYGAKVGNPYYDPNLDINDNGKIFLYDAVILLTHYGQKDP